MIVMFWDKINDERVAKMTLEHIPRSDETLQLYGEVYQVRSVIRFTDNTKDGLAIPPAVLILVEKGGSFDALEDALEDLQEVREEVARLDRIARQLGRDS